MARKLTTREQVMIVALLVAGVVAYRALSGDGIGFGGGDDGKEAEVRTFGEPPVVRMDLLARATESFDAGGRNLFDYYTPPAPPRPKPKPKPPKPKPKPQRTIPAPPPPPPTTVARAPSPGFQYLGFLGPKEEKIAVFDGNEGVMLARIGDVIEKEFRLVEFSHDSVNLAYTDRKWKDQVAELKLKGLR